MELGGGLEPPTPDSQSGMYTCNTFPALYLEPLEVIETSVVGFEGLVRPSGRGIIGVDGETRTRKNSPSEDEMSTYCITSTLSGAHGRTRTYILFPITFGLVRSQGGYVGIILLRWIIQPMINRVTDEFRNVVDPHIDDDVQIIHEFTLRGVIRSVTVVWADQSPNCPPRFIHLPLKAERHTEHFMTSAECCVDECIPQVRITSIRVVVVKSNLHWCSLNLVADLIERLPHNKVFLVLLGRIELP